MLLPLKSKRLGQYNTKSRHVSKKSAVWMGLLTDPISLKLIFKMFLLILGVTSLVPSQCSFPKLQLHVTKKCEIIFVPLCFYLHQLKKSISDFQNSVAQTGNSNIFFSFYFIPDIYINYNNIYLSKELRCNKCKKNINID